MLKVKLKEEELLKSVKIWTVNKLKSFKLRHLQFILNLEFAIGIGSRRISLNRNNGMLVRIGN